ncbi:RS30 protein, partial [Acromyrmex insinuator]
HTTSTAYTSTMQLQIRGQETTIIVCQDNENIQDIKERIASLQGIENEFHLHCNGSLLSDETCVNELQSDVLELIVPLPGGKVHGSLARAGKVKAQTPKVEKQEKSKKKTGRAKRRIQYNRRFVNVVQTFGRRRGPNANTNS